MADLGIEGIGDATLIASGGSALVYRAANVQGEQIAIKVLRGIHGNEVSRRFDRERSAAERLRGHSNIIRVYQTGLTDAGEPYLTMPFFAGGSLHDEIEATGAFPLNKALRDIDASADAIEFAHSNGVLHRDIKPANLLRSNDGSVIVTDFGIARVTNAGITSATVGASTPLYAAPELLAENEVSVHSEVYALGATLYTMLNGQAAFADGTNIWATMHRIRTEPLTRISGVPLPIMRVIEQAMAKEPTERPASAGHLRNLLNEAAIADENWQPPIPAPASAPPLSQESAMSPAHTQTAQRQPTPTPSHPPVPAFDRPAPVVGGQERIRDSAVSKVVAVVAVIAVLAGLGLIAFSTLLKSDTTAGTVSPPIDNTIPLPTTGPEQVDTAGANGEPGDDDRDPEPDPTAAPATRLVSFDGDHFSAFFPEGWQLSGRDIDQGYGFRSTFVFQDMYLNVDTTPAEQRIPGGDIGASARDIAAGINSASTVTTEDIDGLTLHSFTFTNRQGVDSIDIFFEVDGDGYAIVAGSESDPQAAFDAARLVALSIRSTPDQ